jgi:hypothetical protein
MVLIILKFTSLLKLFLLTWPIVASSHIRDSVGQRNDVNPGAARVRRILSNFGCFLSATTRIKPLHAKTLFLGASWQTEGLWDFPEAGAELRVLDDERVFYYLRPITRADV